jgi:hypothetical protein
LRVGSALSVGGRRRRPIRCCPPGSCTDKARSSGPVVRRPLTSAIAALDTGDAARDCSGRTAAVCRRRIGWLVARAFVELENRQFDKLQNVRCSWADGEGYGGGERLGLRCPSAFGRGGGTLCGSQASEPRSGRMRTTGSGFGRRIAVPSGAAGEPLSSSSRRRSRRRGLARARCLYREVDLLAVHHDAPPAPPRAGSRSAPPPPAPVARRVEAPRSSTWEALGRELCGRGRDFSTGFPQARSSSTAGRSFSPGRGEAH